MSNDPGDSRNKTQAVPGRDADAPQNIPATGWLQIIKRVNKKIDEDNIWLVAAGVAFYALLSVFPTLIAMISIYGLVADAATVEMQVQAMSGVLPEDVQVLIAEQMRQIVSASSGQLSLGVVVSVLLAIWTVSTGVYYLIRALNIVYREEETRSFIKLRAISYLLTVAFIVATISAIALVAILPAVLGFVGLGRYGEALLQAGRWPILALGVLIFLAVVNRYGPNRRDPKWRWISVGSVAATIGWLIGSALFSYYVSRFGDFNKTYGSLATPVVLMTWLYLSSFLLLVGAEVNAATEHQTARDTTVGKPKPMGQRGAYVADTTPQPT